MNDTSLFLAIAAGGLAGILYGQQLSEQILARVACGARCRLRELRCVFCCGRVGGLLAALPTLVLAFFLPQYLTTLPLGWFPPTGLTTLAAVGLLTAALLAASLALGAILGAATGKGIANYTRDTDPANHPV